MLRKVVLTASGAITIPTSWLSLTIGAALSLLAGAGPYLIDQFLSAIGLREIALTDLQVDILRIAELLFIGIAMLAASWVCAVDAVVGHKNSANLLTVPIRVLIGISILAAFLLVEAYQGLLVGTYKSLFVSTILSREREVGYFISSCCLASVLLQSLIFRRYQRFLE